MIEIYYNANKMKIFDTLHLLCTSVSLTEKWLDELWDGLLECPELYEEMEFYLKYHMFQDKFKVSGYSLTDLYVYQMDMYNLIGDCGKNPAESNKERLVLKAFRYMIGMMKEPEKYIRRIQEGRGKDII